jgi:hypothetical protein
MTDKISSAIVGSVVRILQTIASMLDYLQALLRDGAAAPPSPSSALPSQPVHNALLPKEPARIDWPQIGGPDFVAPSRHIFLSADYAARFQPGAERTVYVAGCSGMRDLSQASGIVVSKVSSCGGGRLLARVGELNQDRYGAIALHGGEERAEPGWDDWFAIKLKAKTGPAPGSPVTIAERSLVVRLPATMNAQQFDAAFDDLVRHGALAPWLATTDGQRHCVQVGFDSTRGKRFTSYGFDSAPRLSEATELCVFRRHRDHDRLIAIVEYVILRHLGLVP